MMLQYFNIIASILDICKSINNLFFKNKEKHIYIEYPTYIINTNDNNNKLIPCNRFNNRFSKWFNNRFNNRFNNQFIPCNRFNNQFIPYNNYYLV